MLEIDDSRVAVSGFLRRRKIKSKNSFQPTNTDVVLKYTCTEGLPVFLYIQNLYVGTYT